MLILLVLISFFTLTLVFENSALRAMGQWLDEVILSEMHSSTFPQEKNKKKQKDYKLWDCRNDGKWGGEVQGVQAGGERVWARKLKPWMQKKM